MISKEELNIEESKKFIESFFYDNEDDEDQDREIERIDKMTREEKIDELNRIIAAIDVLSNSQQEKIIRQQKLNEINKEMEQWLSENRPQTMSNNQNNYAEVDIEKLIEPKHVMKESNRFEKISNPDVLLPKQTATGQAYKFKKTRKEGEVEKDKHKEIWYGKSSSAGEVAKGIGMSYLFPGAAKYRFVEKQIDGKNVVSQEIKGQSLAQYRDNLDPEYQKLASRKWLYLSGDLTGRDDVLDLTGRDAYLNVFYNSRKMLPYCIERLINTAELIDDEKYNMIQNCKKYLLLPSNIEAVFQNNESNHIKKYSAGKKNPLVNYCPFAYYLTETQNKELLRASFYNYVTGNLDAHSNNLMLTEDGKHVIPFDFDVVHSGSGTATLQLINGSKRYLGPDKFKEYIQEFIADLESKKDKYHDTMEKLYQILEIKGNDYNKTEIIQDKLTTLKELAGIEQVHQNSSWVGHSKSGNPSSDKQIKQ